MKKTDDLRFRILFDQAPFSVQMLASDGTTIEVNRAWVELWASPEDKGLKQYILSGQYNVLTDPQLEAKGVTPFLRRAFTGESVTIPAIYYDLKELGRPGTPRWISAHAHPIFDESANVTQVMLIHTDITSQRQAEIERERTEKALRESEEQLKQIANSVPQLVWMADSEGMVQWYNDRWYEYTGSTFEEMKGLGWKTVHDPEVLPAVIDKWMVSISTGKPFEMTLPLRGKDGKFRPFYCLVHPLRDDFGTIIRWFGTNTDISEMQKTEQALRRVMADLKDADRRKNEFLAMLAHELRNPLAPIGTAAHIIKASPADTERITGAANIINRQVEHMSRLVDDLMDVSRVTRGLAELASEDNLDLKSIVASSIQQTRPLIESRRVSLTTRSSAQGLVVSGDPTRLVQSIANLLNNAAKYTPAGGQIYLAVEEVNQEAHIIVRDTGAGISADFLPHVFELFSQAERTPDRSQGGLGIGLALVKSIAQMHGGSVWAQSAGEGQGSTFTLALPLSKVPCCIQSEAIQELTRASKSMRVVVVDDNKDAADTMAMLLEINGYRPSVYTSATETLASADAAAADIFLLDIGLPDMTGHELCRRLRSNFPASKPLFIALSGYGQEDDRKASLEAGFDLHLVKPVSLEKLSEVLESASRN